jgi:hypothetical protein
MHRPHEGLFGLREWLEQGLSLDALGAPDSAAAAPAAARRRGMPVQQVRCNRPCSLACHLSAFASGLGAAAVPVTCARSPEVAEDKLWACCVPSAVAYQTYAQTVLGLAWHMEPCSTLAFVSSR